MGEAFQKMISVAAAVSAAHSGSRTRLACWFRRLAETVFVEIDTKIVDLVGELYRT
jgi:hypothetical protein